MVTPVLDCVRPMCSVNQPSEPVLHKAMVFQVWSVSPGTGLVRSTCFQTHRVRTLGFFDRSYM